MPAPPPQRLSRPLTDGEVRKLVAYLDAGRSLHLEQQRALASEVLRWRLDATASTPMVHGCLLLKE